MDYCTYVQFEETNNPSYFYQTQCGIIFSKISWPRNSKLKTKRLTGEPSGSAEPSEIVSGDIEERHLSKAVKIQNFNKQKEPKIVAELLLIELTFHRPDGLA